MRRNAGLSGSQGQGNEGAEPPFAGRRRRWWGRSWTNAPIIPSGVQALARREGGVTQSGDGLDGSPDQVVGQGGHPGWAVHVRGVRALGRRPRDPRGRVSPPRGAAEGGGPAAAGGVRQAGSAPERGEESDRRPEPGGELRLSGL